MSPDPTLIDDPADPRLAPYASMRERDLVGRQRCFVVEGEVALRLMLSPGARFALESVLLAPERLSGLRQALSALPSSVPVYVAGKPVMGAVTGFPIHRGVLAIGLRGPEPSVAELVPAAPAPALVLGLAGVSNHDNVGGLLRNAAAFGADAVLIDAETCDPLYRKAIRVSAGAALTVPFARLVPGEDWEALARTHALEPLALSPSGAEDVTGIAPPARALVLVGAEGPGLPEALLARMRGVRIAMSGGFDSLNVATAAAIVLHRLATSRAARH